MALVEGQMEFIWKVPGLLSHCLVVPFETAVFFAPEMPGSE